MLTVQSTGLTSTGTGAAQFTASAANQYGMSVTNQSFNYTTMIVNNAATSGDNVFVEWDAGGAARGTVDFNRAGGAVRYNTTSDMTLKTLIGDAPVEKSVDILKSTKLREFYWNHDETKKSQIGPFAQELYETFKGAVSVGGDFESPEKDAEGNEVTITKYRPWGVDKTAFSFHLVAGWQNHEAKITALEARLAALEAK